MAAVALKHTSLRNTGPSFQGKRIPTLSPLEDFGDSKAESKVWIFPRVVSPENPLSGPFTDCPGFHSPSQTMILSQES